ncbi:CHAT domain-containing protein [Phycicoccus avicenniae]|uniref:CHAT domain-containing protein n=1 Tax=Phycicoccus avicenniae TaxID=2828860 RepID=UPI003D2D64D5
MDAERLLRRAVDLLDGTPGVAADRMRARAMVTLAVPIFERQGLAAALGMLGTAEKVAGSGPAGDSLRALAAIQRAGFLARSGRWADAVAALEGVRDDGDLVGHRELAVALLNRGLARQYLGQFRQSAADLDRASAVAEAGGDTDVRAMAVHDLGCLALLRGEVPEALRLLAEAHRIDPEMSVATTMLDQARAHIEAGLVEEAGVLLGDALAVATSRGLGRVRGEVLLEVARCAVLRGEPSRAVGPATEAARFFAGRDATAWRLHADVAIARARLAAGESGHRLRASIERLDADGAGSPVLHHHVAVLRAEAAVDAGDLAAAREHLAASVRLHRAVLSDRLHHDLVAARIANAAGDATGRSRALGRASLRLAHGSAAYTSLDIRAAVALHGRRLAALDLDAAWASGRPAAVYAATERWRALSLRLPGARAARDDETLADLLTELRLVRRRLLDAGGEDAEPLREEAVRLEREVAHRERELDARTPSDTRSARPASHAEVRRALSERDTGVVALFSHGSRLRAVTLSRNATRVHDLGSVSDAVELSRRLRADLRALSTAPVPALAEAVRRSLTAGLGQLGTLLAPVLELDARRLVLIPSMSLQSVPWRLVPGVDGRPLVVAGSATSWLRRSGTGPASRVVAVGGPGLASADAEVASVLDAWGRGRALVDGAATAASLTDAMAHTDVVHVAAHGTHHDESPLFSSVRLHDGPVFAHELHRRGVGAGHVVLASCDVGSAHLRPGDEALGLTAALLASGARAVLASVAPVRDEVAHAVTVAHHRGLRAGLDAASALEAASAGTPDAGLFAVYGADWAADPEGRRASGVR